MTVIDPISIFAVITGISLLGSFVAGVRTERTHSEEDRRWLRSELQQATERLIHASREPGVTIPPRIEPKDVVPELPAELERLVGDWDSPQVQESLRGQFMRMIEEGLSVQEIKRRHLES